MDRQEPTLGKTDDLSGLEFRRSRYVRSPRHGDRTDISWKIAVGIFIGLTAFALVTCSTMAVLGSAALEEQKMQEQAAADQLRKALSHPDPMGIHAREAQRQRREAEYYALREGERCIDGKRFRRVENGWVQVSRPCR